jgi:hypothetical protein
MIYSNTLDRYKALARSKQEETRFSPSWLKDCEILKYCPKEGFTKNKLLNFDLFQSVIKIQEIGNRIQAVGVCKGQKDTLLILKKK